MAWSLPRGFLEHQPPAGLAWTRACGERINSLPIAQPLILMPVMAAWGPPPGDPDLVEMGAWVHLLGPWILVVCPLPAPWGTLDLLTMDARVPPTRDLMSYPPSWFPISPRGMRVVTGILR